jgi:5'-3' exonuclease
MTRKRILLIDTSSVLHIVKHAGGKNLKAKDKTTYITLGFLFKLQQLMQKTKPSVCVFATDSLPEDSIRKKIYPKYKLKRNTREKSEEEIALDALAWPQFDAVEKEVLPMMGFSNVFMTKGLEADDIIGRICKSYKNCEIVIVTSDQDMYQLLSPTTCILKPKTSTYYTKKMFVKEYGIEPKMWKRVKAIGGCSTDEVKGVPGVAENTALKFIKGELPKHWKSHKAILSKEGKRVINRNKSLVILPFRRTPEYDVQPDRVSKIRVQGMANQFGFKPILSDLENWTRILKGWG